MKTLYPFIIFALSLSISQNAFSNDNVITSIAALCEETISENEYLEYKFGFSKIVTVKVVRRFDNYIISIYSEDRKIIKNWLSGIQIYLIGHLKKCHKNWVGQDIHLMSHIVRQ